MATLAPKLPYTHPFAGGYPGRGSQRLPSDPDALAYLAAVAAADGAAVEVGVAMAVDDFIRGCKADGIWDAIKASCILCGARTLAGALVPLVGAAPTNNNFVSGDYNRETGLVGNGSTKYLDSNRANNADPQNNNHNACWVSVATAGALMASSATNSGYNYVDIIATPATRFASRNNLSATTQAGAATPGLYGHRRSSSLQETFRCPQGGGTVSSTSQAPESRNVYLYVRSNDGIAFSAFSSSRLAFYSIGEAIDLALLDTRVSALVTAIGAAI